MDPNMMIPAPQGQSIATLVRAWLHYTNLVASFTKQATAARKIKDTYENQVITTLQGQGMERAVIQINSGRITVAERREPNQLSLSKIEELLHQYHQQRGGRDETVEIMSFLRANRGYSTGKYLKQSGIPQAPSPV
jgi:hypothetical protein